MAASPGGADSWWVGENLTNQNSFRLGNFFSNNAPSGYQAVQAGNATDAAAFATSLSTGRPTPNLHGISWQIVGGPYATEAEANAALPAIQKAHPAPGAAQQALSGWSITGFSGTNFVLRAVKVIIGGVLLISGIIHLAGVDKDALGIAKNVVIPAGKIA